MSAPEESVSHTESVATSITAARARVPGEGVPAPLAVALVAFGTALALGATSSLAPAERAPSDTLRAHGAIARGRPAPPKAPSPATTCRTFVVGFESAASAPSAEGIAAIERYATTFRDRERALLVEGHADATGAEETNLWLSRRRAVAVADVLVRAGVPRSRIVVRGYGAFVPRANGEADQAADRRVVVRDLACPDDGGRDR